jgi:hypothetical protein
MWPHQLLNRPVASNRKISQIVPVTRTFGVVRARAAAASDSNNRGETRSLHRICQVFERHIPLTTSSSINRQFLVLQEIARIAGSYHAWRGEKDAGKYEDVAGFCKSATRDEVAGHGCVLSPGRYVGAADAEDDDDMPFDERMEQLTGRLKEQFKSFCPDVASHERKTLAHTSEH